MINPFKEINWKPAPPELRKLGWSLVIGFPCIALILFLIVALATKGLPSPTFFLLLGGIGAGIGVIALLVPPVAKPVYILWYGIAGCVGIVMANLLFTVLYYILFTPLGLLMRLFGRDPLDLKNAKGATTYWKEAPPARPATQYFRQY